ncbi:putative nucleotidyltransferase [Methanosarcina siciliae T4/M]|uniref:Putative nucleotidyltransferase n=2 Tax=Methanosarcina siciliae TaxID=38027 RepID=A0A0E3P9Y0_9EURY|nr:nucleotidyltransferase domain-containing protein [Methanosarcina siciliae]AKB26868.1 putative nucleotidyltransferase [Methanosarcina siciliae T4/M]AKB30835.1 putative nucleotidyltransferase [Methanosarcina siciliae HI350]
MDKSSFLEDISKILAGLKEVDTAYVFGSFLERTNFNDIDVALLLSESLDPYQSLKFSLRIAGELERRIRPRFEFDVKILNNSPIEFQFEVIKKGHVIFSRNEPNRIDYESEVISAYLDLKYMYDLIDKEFLARA